jgi:hypothetical protein
MNLSSDQDALRLLLVMGEEKVNAMFRKEWSVNQSCALN